MITGIFGIPRMVIKFLIGRRQKKFLEEFAEALEAMVRLLKSGMPVSEAIHMVGREFGGPVGEEMDRIYDEQRVGVTLPEAVHKAAERMPLTEMKMFATGITIQAETGSSLSEVLTNLANVIRDRYRLKRKVKAMSAEAKTSAIIIGSLPLFVSGMLYFLNPGYMQPMLDSSTGRLVLYGAGVWMVIGMIVIRQMINFKI
jgi:tight adherence protein B